jgi:hypothetical protein
MFFVSFSPNIFFREKLFSPNLVKYKQLALCVRACVRTCSRATARLHDCITAQPRERAKNHNFSLLAANGRVLKSGIFLKRNERTNERKSNPTKKGDF